MFAAEQRLLEQQKEGMGMKQAAMLEQQQQQHDTERMQKAVQEKLLEEEKRHNIQVGINAGLTIPSRAN